MRYADFNIVDSLLKSIQFVERFCFSFDEKAPKCDLSAGFCEQMLPRFSKFTYGDSKRSITLVFRPSLPRSREAIDVGNCVSPGSDDVRKSFQVGSENYVFDVGLFPIAIKFTRPIRTLWAH
jgi:hypothetical protein